MTEVETRPPRPDKVAAVEDVKARLAASSAVILTEYRGMTVDQLQTLRRSLRDAGAEYRVVKCTLARLAASEAGFDDLVPMLEGPVALTFVREDAAAAAKALVDVGDDVEALVIRGGILDGAVIEEADTQALAKLPSRETLLAQIAGAFQAPLQKAANLLNAPLQNFANLVDALETKRGEEGDSAPEPTEGETGPEPDAEGEATEADADTAEADAGESEAAVEADESTGDESADSEDSSEDAEDAKEGE